MLQLPLLLKKVLLISKLTVVATVIARVKQKENLLFYSGFMGLMVVNLSIKTQVLRLVQLGQP